MSAHLLPPGRADHLSLARWGYFLAAAVLAGCSAGIVYRSTVVQSYPELIVGYIAWSYASKTNDYAMLFSFVACFFAFLWLLTALAARVEKAWQGTEAAFHDFVVLLCVPAGVWLAGLLATRATSVRALEISGILLVIGLSLTFILARRKSLDPSGVAPLDVVQRAILFVFLCVLAFACVAVGIQRLGAAFGSTFWIPSRTVLMVSVAILLAAWAAAAAACATVRSLPSARRLFDRAILGLQFALPASFLLLVPEPWVVDGRLTIGYPMTAWAWAFIGACVFGAYVSLVRHARRREDEVSSSAVALLSTGSLIALLLFLKALPAGAPSVWTDDYHDGEVLVPWWSMVQHHLVPFVDYTPARGLTNYVFGSFHSVLFDGKVSSSNAVFPFMYAALLWLVVPVLARVVGRGIAVLAMFFVPYVNGLSEIDVVVTAFLCVACATVSKWRPAAWVALWGILGTAVVLFAPGQGALAVVATSPLGAFMLYRMQKGERDGWKILAGALGAAVLLALLTPLGPMVFGAVRYGLEQSGVNSVAHGVQWYVSFGKAATNPWLFELMRTTWLLAGLGAGVLIWKTLRQEGRPERQRVLVYAVPVLILSVLFIVRAAGRIDADGDVSRLGLASIWGVSLLLPVVIFAAARVRPGGAILLSWLAIAGLVQGAFGGMPTSYARHFEPMPDPRRSPAWIQSVAALPETGSGIMVPAHIDRLVALRKVLDTVLAPDETYLDVSGRHATYFYFQRRPPIETGSVYNLVTEKQQLRAIAALRKDPPPLVLIKADNYTHDGGPASLRAHLLYRYLLLSNRYKVATIGTHVWLVDAARVGRLASLGASIVDVADSPDSPLNAVFATTHLHAVPASWGRSLHTLEKRLAPVGRVAASDLAGTSGVAAEPSGSFRVTGPDPAVRYSVAKLNISGSDAGVLGFEFRCTEKPGGKFPVVEVYWSTASQPESEHTVTRMSAPNGQFLVPLDAYPAWLLAGPVKTLRFDVQDPDSCSSFAVHGITLYQRAAAERLRPVAARQGVAGS